MESALILTIIGIIAFIIFFAIQIDTLKRKINEKVSIKYVVDLYHDHNTTFDRVQSQFDKVQSEIDLIKLNLKNKVSADTFLTIQAKNDKRILDLEAPIIKPSSKINPNIEYEIDNAKLLELIKGASFGKEWRVLTLLAIAYFKRDNLSNIEIGSILKVDRKEIGELYNLIKK